MDIRLDDILAALLLTLAMMRRLEVKGAVQPPGSGEGFLAWRRQALRIYGSVAAACLGKIVLNISWFYFALSMALPSLLIQGVGAALFISWVLFLIWSWKAATEATHVRLKLGVSLKRPRPSQSSSRS